MNKLVMNRVSDLEELAGIGLHIDYYEGSYTLYKKMPRGTMEFLFSGTKKEFLSKCRVMRVGIKIGRGESF